MNEEQLAELHMFESSSSFDRREKVALRYAEATTRTPTEVSDSLFEDVLELFSTEQIVELTATIALENFRARFNCALKIESDGLCVLPADHPVRRALPASQK